MYNFFGFIFFLFKVRDFWTIILKRVVILDFKCRLKQLRDEHQLTQSELGKILNISKQSISSYENGGSFPPPDMLGRLIDYFGVTSDYILGRTDIRNPESLTLDEELQQLLNDPDTLVAFKDFKNLSDSDKQEIINFIKFKKQQNN